jgi:predicted GNAT family acetyltransferase
MSLQNPIVNNKKLSRFETAINEEFAYVEYRFYKDDIVLMHTFVPEFASGKGIASALAKFVLEYVKDQKLKLKVYCPVISKYIKNHPEYESLIDRANI